MTERNNKGGRLRTTPHRGAVERVLHRAANTDALTHAHQAHARLHVVIIAQTIIDAATHSDSHSARRALFVDTPMVSIEALALDLEFVQDIARRAMRAYGVGEAADVA